MKSTKFILSVLLFVWSPLLMSQTIEELDQKISVLQEEVNYVKPGKSNFMLRGYAHAGLEYNEPEDNLSFVGGAFNPLFIYQQSDRLLFESELEFHFEGNQLSLGLEYANISYLLTPAMILRAGKFFIPFGIFMDRLHPAWINKFPHFPLGFGHDALLPGTDVGVEMRGAFYAGTTKLNYALFVANGPQLNQETGQLIHGKLTDNNFAKTFGGRFGIFPFHDSSLELGLSANYGKVGERGSEYEDVAALLYAFDLSYIKAVPSLKSVIDIKAQASLVNVDDAAYAIPTDTTGNLFYDFDNKSQTWFAQFSVKPAFVSSKVFRNVEFNGRYSEINTPSGSTWEMDGSQWDLGINYWLDWRTVVKVSYRIGQEVAGGHDEGPGEEGEGHGSEGGNAFFIHWAIGF